jgi:uncharacterized protein
MPRTVEHSDPVSLDALDEFLMSDRVPENSMGLSDLDGFLTAIAIGPELIMPSEWLPVVWGGEEPAFDDLDEAQTILSLVMARYNEIIAGLQAGGDDWAPVFWGTPDGNVIVTDWAAGFLDAVRLRPDAWMPLFDDPDAGVAMMPILLAGSDGFAEEMGIGRDEEEQLLRQAADDIPLSVVGIDMFWKERRGAGVLSRSGPRRSSKVGRNEPCPCGSGRKYKRCCGAN